MLRLPAPGLAVRDCANPGFLPELGLEEPVLADPGLPDTEKRGFAPNFLKGRSDTGRPSLVR
ncbi:MAG: hypothetical protein WA476_20780, partial [Acidobacteriaceae bacterium]